MYKLLSSTIEKSIWLGEFQTEAEAKKEKSKVEKEGVGIISITKNNPPVIKRYKKI